jgi:hypothetical protein
VIIVLIIIGYATGWFGGAPAPAPQQYRYMTLETIAPNEVFRDAMALNLEFGSADIELFPEDHITPEIITQVKKDWQ